jgi:hypothetical protein
VWLRLVCAGLVCATLAPAVLRAAEAPEKGKPEAAAVQPALFALPELALQGLRDALEAADRDEALLKLFGPLRDEIVSADAVQRKNDLDALAKHVAEYAGLAKQSDEACTVLIGKEKWPSPIPIVKKDGKWFFDAAAGKEEILNRRIGKNELNAIEVCRAFVQAEREYAMKDRQQPGVIEYAQRIRSTAGEKNGLYWETKPDEEASPFGPFVANAQDEGYYGKRDAHAKGRAPFHGYIFKVLKQQGKNAPGGKYDYVINGHMVAGFALLAYPEEWGNTGVMTFCVNQNGKVCQKNLGENTAALAKEMKEYDPDESWTAAE